MSNRHKTWYFHPCEGDCGCVLPWDPEETGCACLSSCASDTSWPLVIPVYAGDNVPAGAKPLTAISWKRVSVDGPPERAAPVLYWPSGRYPEFLARFDPSRTPRGGDSWLPLDDLYKIPTSTEKVKTYEIPVDTHVVDALLRGEYPSKVALEKIVDSIAVAAGSTAPPSASM